MTSVDTKTALLLALAEGDSFGLDLIERVKNNSNGLITIQQGRVYPVLKELEENGFLVSYDGEAVSERGGRPRRYYRLTAKGVRSARERAHAVVALTKFALGNI